MFKQYLYNHFPVIDLENIILRELTSDDAEDYMNYMSRKEMRPFLTDSNIPKTIGESISEVKYWSSLFQNRVGIYWAIALKDNNKLIGTAGCNSLSMRHLKAEISYDLDFDFWGKAIMLKSIKNIIKFLEYIGIVRIQATVICDNTKSINLLERCNFFKEGLLKKYEIVEGVHKDYYIYARVA